MTECFRLKLDINSVSPLLSGFSSMKRQSISTSPTDGMQIHRTHLYTWVERGSVRVKCLAQQHNTWFEDPETSTLANHEATAPPNMTS